MKLFYSCIDSHIPSPQPEQHSLIERMAKRCGGKITYSTSEDCSLRNSQAWIEERVERISDVDGLVFFTVEQFFCGRTFNIQLLRRFLSKNIEVHFSRENLSFRNNEDLEFAESAGIFIFLDCLSNQKISNNSLKLY
jgi:hypothetical protein